MCRKMICFVLLATVCLVLPVSGELTADSVAHWTLDEAIGDIALDSSGNGNDAVIFGDEWKIVAGKINGAIELKGSDYALATDFPVPSSTVTVTAWVYAYSKPGWGSMVKNWGSSETGQFHLGLDAGAANLDVHITQSGGGTVNVNEGVAFPIDEWQHVAFVADGTMVRLYRNGAEVGSAGYDGSLKTSHTGVGIGLKPNNEGTGPDSGIPAYWDGLIDDVWILSRGLTPEELQVIMEGRGAGPVPQAFGPSPVNGALHEDTWLNLSWRPGDFAVSHDVYIGDNFDDVDNGAEGSFIGNQGGTFIVLGFPGFPFPDGLIPGTTYYWRIDEVNATEPNSPWIGPVWSFSIPPKTAYFPDPADTAESVEMDVTLSWTPGFGAKLHTVYFGESFDEVNNAAGGQAQGAATYTPGTLKMAQTYYWRVDEFDVVDTFKGDVWSFITQGAVGSPSPAKGAVDVKQTSILTWTPGFGASHEIYFGTDAGSLENKASGNLGSESFYPGQLEWDTTYYWRIDEANNTNADSPWTGPLWSFTTANFLIIDDFESYNDLNEDEPGSNRIYLAWIDGFENPAVNGSVVGNFDPPFAEQTIVHGGLQSMPMAYDNAVGKSEATLTLISNRDWTVNGVNTLMIWYRGGSANAAENLYVALNGNAVVNHDNPDAAQATSWTQWNVDLQAFADQGVNLANVTSITLGLGNRSNPVAGGSGMMYFDDIRLYPLDPETP